MILLLLKFKALESVKTNNCQPKLWAVRRVITSSDADDKDTPEPTKDNSSDDDSTSDANNDSSNSGCSEDADDSSHGDSSNEEDGLDDKDGSNLEETELSAKAKWAKHRHQ